MRKYRRKIGDFAKGYKRAIAFMSLLFVIGIFIGSLCAVLINGDKLSEIQKHTGNAMNSYGFQDVDKMSLFQSAAKNDFLSLVLIWVFGFSSFLIPLVFLEVIVRGLKLGFSIGVVVRIFGGKGFVFALCSTFIQNIIFIPVFVFLAVFSIQNAVKFKKIKKSKDRIGQRRVILQNLAVLSGIIAIVFLCGALEGYAVPYVIKPFF